MSKSSASSPLKSANFNDSDSDWSNHPAVEWFLAHKQIVLWVLLALLLLLMLIYRLLSMQTLKAESDFFQAQTTFNQFQRTDLTTPENALNDLTQLDLLLKRRPELQAKYDGPVAQTLLIAGQVPQAQQFAQRIFERTESDNLSFYQDYTRTSLLIEEGRAQEALQQAAQLKQVLDQQTLPAKYDLLYVFNLVRLAFLYQQNGNYAEELQTWEALQNQPQRLEAVVLADQTFKVGQASLNAYSEERRQNVKKMLSSQKEN